MCVCTRVRVKAIMHVCIQCVLSQSTATWAWDLWFQMNAPASGIPLSTGHTHSHTNLHLPVLCFLLLIKAPNLHCTLCICTQIHTTFKRIFPFAQQTSSYLFSHLKSTLLADRWALENCCCLSEQGDFSHFQSDSFRAFRMTRWLKETFA